MRSGFVLAIAVACGAGNADCAQFVAYSGLDADRVVDLSERAPAFREAPWAALPWQERSIPVASSGVATDFTAIARQGQALPPGESGNLGYMLLNPATLDASGRGAFVSGVDGAERNQGIFLAGEHSLKVIAMGCGEGGGSGSQADCGDPSPIGGTFSGMFQGTLAAPAANDHGDVLFLADLVGAPSPRALFLYRFGDDSIVKIAAVGDPAPRGGTLLAIGAGVINNAGMIAFTARTIEGQLAADSQLLWQDGVLSTYLASGDPAPGGESFIFFGGESREYLDGTWIPVSVPALNERNELAFKAHTESGDGLYRSRNGLHEQLARWEDPEPGGGVFFDFRGDPVLNGRGEIAFMAYTAASAGAMPSAAGWFVGDGQPFRRALGDGDTLPQGEISSFAFSRNPFRPLDDAGNLALWARYRLADTSEREVILLVRRDGTREVLVEQWTDSPLGGSWGVLNPWITSNNNAQIQFQAGTLEFAASTHGQFVATYESASCLPAGSSRSRSHAAGNDLAHSPTSVRCARVSPSETVMHRERRTQP